MESNLYRRLSLDPSFASWFHFKYCHTTVSDLCFFQNPQKANLNPVLPIYFAHVINDHKLTVENYRRIITAIKNDVDALGDRTSYRLSVECNSDIDAGKLLRMVRQTL